MSDFRFEFLANAGAARRGRLTTAHGTVETPAFMPVGTAATVKAMMPESVRETGAEMILANAYHLMLTSKCGPCMWIGWLVMVRLPMRTRTRSPCRTTSGSMPGNTRVFQVHRLKSVMVMTLGR